MRGIKMRRREEGAAFVVPVISALVGFCPTAGNGRTGIQNSSVSSYREPGGSLPLRAGSSAWALLSSGLGTSLPGGLSCAL